MQLLDERGVAGEAARIELFHFLDEFLNLLGIFRIFPHGLAQLIQVAQRVIIRALRGNRRIVGLDGGTSARRIISRVQIAVHGAVAPAAGVGVAIRSAVVATTADSCARAAVGASVALISAAAKLLAAALP